MKKSQSKSSGKRRQAKTRRRKKVARIPGAISSFQSVLRGEMMAAIRNAVAATAEELVREELHSLVGDPDGMLNQPQAVVARCFRNSFESSNDRLLKASQPKCLALDVAQDTKARLTHKARNVTPFNLVSTGQRNRLSFIEAAEHIALSVRATVNLDLREEESLLIIRAEGSG